jgi:Xaa-Pro aminopeptidase
MFDLAAIQSAVREYGFDGWLLHDFRGSNLLARRILDLDGKPTTSRRFYYFIPPEGEPTRLVHQIETGVLDHLPGSKHVYLRWQELETAISSMVAGRRRVAMEYSPRNSIPYISRTDAGTIEVIRSAGGDVASSGDLIQRFEATWDDDQWAMHREAERHTTSAYDVAWTHIADRVRSGHGTSEFEVQCLVMDHFRHHGLTTYSPPIVAVGPHAGDPHFETTEERDTPIREGDLVLLDLWAKVDKPRAVYSDLTRMGFVGEAVPSAFGDIFAIVARARDAAIDLVKDAYASGRELRGWEVDDACRAVIDATKYGPQFLHRTGHNIGQEVHGNGANMDNLETREERLVMRRTCFSVEPGIYSNEFGMRSEINVFVDASGLVHVTGGPVQQRIVPILSA